MPQDCYYGYRIYPREFPSRLQPENLVRLWLGIYFSVLLGPEFHNSRCLLHWWNSSPVSVCFLIGFDPQGHHVYTKSQALAPPRSYNITGIGPQNRDLLVHQSSFSQSAQWASLLQGPFFLEHKLGHTLKASSGEPMPLVAYLYLYPRTGELGYMLCLIPRLAMTFINIQRHLSGNRNLSCNELSPFRMCLIFMFEDDWNCCLCRIHTIH